MGKILITGATGKLGKQTIDHLLLTKNVPATDIIALVRNKDKAKYLSDKGIELRLGTYDDQDSLIKAFTDIDKLFLISSPVLDPTERLQQQFNAIMAAKKAQVNRIFITSLADPQNRIFGLEDVDMASEHMVQSLGIPFTILQNGVYFEEIKHDVRIAMNTGILSSVTKDSKFNFVSREDLALVNATVLSEEGHENKIYRLVNSELTTYSEISKILSDISKNRIIYKEFSEEELIDNLMNYGIHEAHAKEFIVVFQKAIANDIYNTTSEDLTDLIGNKKSSIKQSVSKIIDII